MGLYGQLNNSSSFFHIEPSPLKGIPQLPIAKLCFASSFHHFSPEVVSCYKRHGWVRRRRAAGRLRAEQHKHAHSRALHLATRKLSRERELLPQAINPPVHRLSVFKRRNLQPHETITVVVARCGKKQEIYNKYPSPAVCSLRQDEDEHWAKTLASV